MPRTVLVVDDDAGIRNLLEFRLEKSGFGVRTCKNGYECLDALREGALPAAVLLDVRMPRLDGMDVLDTIRTEFADLPVVLLSGVKPAGEIEEMSAVAAHIEKPFRMEEVIACLERVLDGRKI